MADNRKPAYNISLNKALKQGGFYGTNGIWNSLVKVDGRVLRGRVEVLVLKKDRQQIFMHIKSYNKKKYRVPGGSYEKDVPNYIQAQNEVNEEARIKVKGLVNSGEHYINLYKNPTPLYGSNFMWVGNYTEVYVGEYDGKYDGFIAEEDKDEDMYNKGKFYNIYEVYPILNDTHRKIIDSIFPSLDKGSINENMVILRESNSKPHYYPYYTPFEMSKLGVFNESSNKYSNIEDEAIEWYLEYTDSLRNPDSENWLKELQDRYNNYIKESTDENKQLILDLGWNPEVPVTMENVLIASSKTKERLKESTDEKLVLNEGLIFSGKDIALNIDDFESGKSNILFITGLAGSGKTTLAGTLEEQYGAEVVSLDYFQHEVSFYNGYFKEFKDTISYKLVEKYMKENPDVAKNRDSFNGISLENFSEYFVPFFGWLVNTLRKDKSKKYIVEGIHILLFIPYKEVKGYPLYCVNTSAIKSLVRHWKRDDWTIEDIIKNGYGDLLKFKDWNDQYKRFKDGLREEYVEESYFKNAEDIYYNIDKVDKGENRVIYVTGHSGSGKSTLRQELQDKYKNIVGISGDYITMAILHNHSKEIPKKWDLSKSIIKNKLPEIVYNYMTTHQEWKDFFNNDFDMSNIKRYFNHYLVNEYFQNFIEWLEVESKKSKHYGTIFVVEGTQVLMIPDLDFYEDKPLIIKGTSAATSYIRKQKRDIFNPNDIKSISWGKVKNSMIRMIPNYINYENKMRELNSIMNESSYFPNTDIIESSTYYNGEYLEEGYVKNMKDIYYNKDKFDSGEINLCFITGLSGSGKSTMARGMAKDTVEHYELDDVIANKVNFTMQNFKDYGDLIYSFFNGVGKKYFVTAEDTKKDKSLVTWKDYDKELVNDFVEYSMKYANSHKSRKFVVEGIWLFKYIQPAKLDKYAVYIKGTSGLISTIRAMKRDYNRDKNEGIKFNQRVSWVMSRLFSDIRRMGEFENKIQNYRNYFSKMSTNESVETLNETTKSKVLNEILIFNEKLNHMEYILPNRGNVITRIKHDDYEKRYYGLSPSEFEKYNGGVCWDYVVYQACYFKKNFKKVPFKTFFIVLEDEDGDRPTHSIMIFYLNNKVYWFESSWKSIRGIYEFKSEYDALNCVVQQMIEKQKIDNNNTIYAQEVKEYNATDPKLIGLSCNEYYNYMNGINSYNISFTNKKIKLPRNMNRITPIGEATDDKEYGLPQLKKYPMPDEKHVLSAIRFFNYVSPANEEELARNIKKKMKQYDIPPSKVGDKNRLKKYLKEDTDLIQELMYHCIDERYKPVLVFDLGSVLIDSKAGYLESLYKSSLIPNNLAQKIHDYIMVTFKGNSEYLSYCTTSEYYKFMTDKAPEELKKYIPAAISINIKSLKKLPYTDSLLKKLKEKGYTLLYLSNWDKWSRDELLKNGAFDFLKYFDGGIFSCDVKCSKPDYKIYKELFKISSIDPKATVFFDDNYENIKAAMELGINGVLFNKDYTPQWICDTFLSGELIQEMSTIFNEVSGYNIEKPKILI